MLRFQFIETRHYPLSQSGLHLFQYRDSGEVVLLACQVASLFGYHSLSRLLRHNADCHPSIHFSVLEKESLREFKSYLSQLQLPGYRNCRSLLLITETGVAYLLGKHCKPQVLRVGEWLLQQVFPTIRPTLPLFYQNINSLYLDITLGVIMFHGRCGIFSRQLTSLLRCLPLDHIDRGCHGYIENIHLSIWNHENYRQLQGLLAGLPEAEESHFYFFYESGIYRYLNNISHPLVPLLKLAFEREIFPWCRRLASHWPVAADAEGDTDTAVPQLSGVTDEAMDDASRPMPVLEPTSGWPSPVGQNEMQEMLAQIQRMQEMQQDYHHKLQMIEQEQHAVKESLHHQHSTMNAKLDLLYGFLQQLNGEAVPIQPQPDIDFEAMPESTVPDDAAAKEDQKNSCKLSMLNLKQLARSLGVYFDDQVTPNTPFVQALIEYAGTSDRTYLQWIIINKLKISNGMNSVPLDSKVFDVWKE